MGYTASNGVLTLSNLTYPWRTDTDKMPSNLILTVLNPDLAVLCWEEEKHGNQTLLLVSNDHTFRASHQPFFLILFRLCCAT